ncbi:immunoglobulin-like domain-containing protein [Enterococcus avium]
MGKPGKKVSNTQSSNTSPAKENTATSNQQSKKRNTTKNSKNTTEKLTTESSTMKPVGKTSTETTTDSQIKNGTNSSAVETEKVEVKPLDVNPFPPNKPTDTHPAINILPTQSIRKGSSFDPKQGVSASDKTDGDLTSKITVTGTVDTNTVGEYLLTYSVTNSQGNTATQSAIIQVVEDNIGMYEIEIADFSLPKGSDYIQAIRERIVIRKPDGKEVPTADANIVVAAHHSTCTWQACSRDCGGF